ncbi:sulfite exporter TauE/SafE family protein [Sphingobium sp. HBC34]|uniref:Probable membrane transporter protein n=1 Tax=Sphingobium cyanobacteriorum TaxID=3063954 RepID=A0ABT8ZJT7_9SPHN|nr:sulfite exporter TauE/SafE family protein [Sphingobium sp. HBC34]MDO7833816.1 sulfite exporter TauE/SafE family protein [Sphingobium sp. HBC34]
MIDMFLANFGDIWPFILVGFGAQIIDGALGMAYGVISSTLLLTLGVPPSRASASVHVAETFTTGVSAISHILHRNVDWKLFAKLIIPGVIGGVTGAYMLSNIDGSVVKPFIQVYLASIGLYLIWRGFHLPPKPRDPKWVGPLGLVGGFMDATGGGGWGPIVTSNLLLQGSSPRHTIGTVNTVEFILTSSISLTFLIHLGWQAFTTYTLGLVIGGVVAAPFGAMLARRVAPRILFSAVGVILTITSLFGVAKYLGYIG